MQQLCNTLLVGVRPSSVPGPFVTCYHSLQDDIDIDDDEQQSTQVTAMYPPVPLGVVLIVAFILLRPHSQALILSSRAPILFSYLSALTRSMLTINQTIYTLHHSSLLSSCFGFTSTLQMYIHYFPNSTCFPSPLLNYLSPY